MGLGRKTKGERRREKAKRTHDKHALTQAEMKRRKRQLAPQAQSPVAEARRTQATPAREPMTRRGSLAFGMMLGSVVLEFIAVVLFIVLWFNAPHNRVVLACGCVAVGALVLFLAAALPERRFTLRETIARLLAGGGATAGISAAALTGWWWTVFVALPIFFLGFWQAPKPYEVR